MDSDAEIHKSHTFDEIVTDSFLNLLPSSPVLSMSQSFGMVASIIYSRASGLQIYQVVDSRLFPLFISAH